jgi:hypothetical protein
MQPIDVVDIDPYEYVVSANLHRRHLTQDQREEFRIKYIALHPEKSDRQIAKTLKTDHHQIARARARGEDVGRISHVETRTDSTGRRSPSTKPPRRRTPPKPPAAPVPVKPPEPEAKASTISDAPEAATGERSAHAPTPAPQPSPTPQQPPEQQQTPAPPAPAPPEKVEASPEANGDDAPKAAAGQPAAHAPAPAPSIESELPAKATPDTVIIGAPANESPSIVAETGDACALSETDLVAALHLLIAQKIGLQGLLLQVLAAKPVIRPIDLLALAADLNDLAKALDQHERADAA